MLLLLQLFIDGLAAGALYALTCLAAYGVFRLGLRPLYAAAGTLLFALCPLHLTIVPHLRDYSRGPFILGLLFLLGLAIRRKDAWPASRAVGSASCVVSCASVGRSRGARIVLCDPHRALVAGPSPLRGATVESPDIRALRVELRRMPMRSDRSSSARPPRR